MPPLPSPPHKKHAPKHRTAPPPALADHPRAHAATWFLYVSVVASAILIGGVLWVSSRDPGSKVPVTSRENHSNFKLAEIPFNGKQAYQYLKQICAFGPRFSGSPGMVAQQKLLTDHFTQMGGEVSRQEFQVRHPQTGDSVSLANLIVQWHPDRKQRILLCAHYDTRPFPDRDPDPRRRQGRFVGANDGASGVALLMELATAMATLQGPSGVDFVFFDGEEFVYDDQRDHYFLGSEYFAKAYVQDPPEHRYQAAVLVDMVGDKDLKIYQEKQSVSWPDSRPLVNSIWATASRLKVREFVARSPYAINDDHVALHDIGGIPACDIIDFEYPRYPGWGKSYWHTAADTPEQCSAISLAKVGWVLQEWLAEQ